MGVDVDGTVRRHLGARGHQLFRRVFPVRSRGFAGQRWVSIALRCLHLLGIAGSGGLFLYGADHAAAWGFLHLAIWSGVGMAAVRLWCNGSWLLQMRGLVTVLKVLLLAGVAALEGPSAAALFAGVIVLSGVFAHAPGHVRYYSPLHGRRLDTL